MISTFLIAALGSGSAISCPIDTAFSDFSSTRAMEDNGWVFSNPVPPSRPFVKSSENNVVGENLMCKKFGWWGHVQSRSAYVHTGKNCVVGEACEGVGTMTLKLCGRGTFSFTFANCHKHYPDYNKNDDAKVRVYFRRKNGDRKWEKIGAAGTLEEVTLETTEYNDGDELMLTDNYKNGVIALKQNPTTTCTTCEAFASEVARSLPNPRAAARPRASSDAVSSNATEETLASRLSATTAPPASKCPHLDAKCFCDSGVPATGPACERSGIKCTSCGTGYSLDRDTANCRKPKCTCDHGAPAEGEDCEEDGELCVHCDKGYRLSWSTNRCEREGVDTVTGGTPDTVTGGTPGKACKCFQGAKHQQGVPYAQGDEVVEIIDGQKRSTEVCTNAERNTCLGCTRPGWVLYAPSNEPTIKQCIPKQDRCNISFYSECNFKGKVCHMSWHMNRYANEVAGWEHNFPPSDQSRGSVYNNYHGFENLPSYDPEQCDWMWKEGVESIKRPTKGQVYRPPHDVCWVRIRAGINWNTDFRILFDDEEVRCFETSDHDISGPHGKPGGQWIWGHSNRAALGGPQPEIDRKIAQKVYAITKEPVIHC